MADRKPLIVLGILAVVAILLFVFGAFGASRGASAGALPEWAAPRPSGGDQLTTGDLSGSSSCEFAGPVITFIGVCQVDVRKVTGGFPWQQATRTAILTAGPQAVGVTVTLAGRTLHTTLDPGDDVRLTFTRDGGAFVLTCTTPTGCAAVLSKDA